MNLQSFPGVLEGITFGTVVGECVWIVLAFDVVLNIHNSLVGELQADTTCWYSAVIADHKFDEFLWAREISLKEKSSVNRFYCKVILHLLAWFCRDFLDASILSQLAQL